MLTNYSDYSIVEVEARSHSKLETCCIFSHTDLLKNRLLSVDGAKLFHTRRLSLRDFSRHFVYLTFEHLLSTTRLGRGSFVKTAKVHESKEKVNRV